MADPPTTAPFSMGIAPITRRIVRAKRPVRRRAASVPTPAELPAASEESSDDDMMPPPESRSSSSDWSRSSTLSMIGVQRNISDSSSDGEVSTLFNVVSPLSIQNRFQDLQDDDDDDSYSSMPTLENIDRNITIRPKPSATKSRSRKKSKQIPKSNDEGNICSICIEPDDPSSQWNNLVILPCCGASASGTPKELNFSMRFCSGCILKLAKISVDKDSDEYSPWEDQRQTFP
jgi:hypothetical protein